MIDETTQQQSQRAQPKATVDALSKLAGFLRSTRLPYEQLMQDACAMFAPELRKDGVEKGMAFGRDLFDGYPQIALERWAKGLPGNMVYRDAQWVNMQINIRQLADHDEVKKYTDEQSKIVFWSARRSNFYDLQPHLARHAAVMGGYCWPVVDHRQGAVQFVLLDPWKVWVARDGFGHVQFAMREITQTVVAWANDIGEDNLPDRWRQELTAPSGNRYADKTAVQILHPNGEAGSIIEYSGDEPWVSVYFSEQEKHVMHSRAMNYGIIDWPVRLPPGWDYPATPAMYAYVDALTNDVLSETLVESARLAADPPIKAMERLSKKLDMRPGGVTWIDRPEDIVEQVQKNGNWPVGDAERDHVKANLDRWFSVPFFEMLSRWEGQPPTAYHIRQLAAEKGALLGPEVGSYRKGVLDPSVDILLAEEAALTGDEPEQPQVVVDWIRNRVLSELERMHLPVTEANVNAYLRDHAIARMEAKYNGLLTSIESEMAQNRSYFDGIGLLQAAAEIWPDAPLVGNAYKVLRNSLEAMDWSAEDIRTESEYKKALEELAQQEQMQQQAAMMKDIAAAQQQQAKAGQLERT